MSVSFVLKMFMSAVIFWVSTFGGMTADEVCMIGHRGFSSIHPDNTEISFRKAAEAGAGGCETDVRVTSDGVYVLSHNGTAEFKDGTELTIADHTLAELTAKPLSSSTLTETAYLCTYEKYLEIMSENNMVCFIELKGDFSDEQIKEIFDIAAAKYDLEKCILQSFEIENLIKAREIVPDLPLMLTYDADMGDYSQCFDYGISIDSDYSAITEQMVSDFHSHGLVVGAWTVNSLTALGYVRSLGVDYVESDIYMK